jgi:hypothetical protein
LKNGDSVKASHRNIAIRYLGVFILLAGRDRLTVASRLRADGYGISVDVGYLFVRDIPYVNLQKAIQRGVLISTLKLAGDVTSRPDTHVAYFRGEPRATPTAAKSKGSKIRAILQPGSMLA